MRTNNKAMEKAIECKMHQEEEEPVRLRDSVPDLTTGVQNGDLDDLSSGGTRSGTDADESENQRGVLARGCEGTAACKERQVAIVDARIIKWSDHQLEGPS